MRFRLALIGLLSALVVACSCSSSEDADATPVAMPQVFAVHGLGRTSSSMSFLASRLERAGYEVFNYGDPSTAETMEELVARLDAEVRLRWMPGPATHTFTMNRRDVADETLHFLRHDGFRREAR